MHLTLAAAGRWYGVTDESKPISLLTPSCVADFSAQVKQLYCCLLFVDNLIYVGIGGFDLESLVTMVGLPSGETVVICVGAIGMRVPFQTPGCSL